MVSTSVVDDIIVGWGVSSHSLAASGICMSSILADAESTHRSMSTQSYASIRGWSAGVSTMSMDCVGVAAFGVSASAVSSHPSMGCSANAYLEVHVYAENSMAMRSQSEVKQDRYEFEILQFVR